MATGLKVFSSLNRKGVNIHMAKKAVAPKKPVVEPKKAVPTKKKK